MLIRYIDYLPVLLTVFHPEFQPPTLPQSHRQIHHLYGHKNGHIIVKLTCNPTPCLTVEDDGTGIPEVELNKIFERFYRIPGSAGNGCGLGLAIVKEIADLHNAQVQLRKSKFKSGTRIDLIF